MYLYTSTHVQVHLNINLYSSIKVHFDVLFCCGLMIPLFDRPLSFVEDIPSCLQDLSGEQAQWQHVAHGHTLLLEAELLPTILDSMVSSGMAGQFLSLISCYDFIQNAHLSNVLLGPPYHCVFCLKTLFLKLLVCMCSF